MVAQVIDEGVGLSLQLQKLFELAIHDFDRLMGAIDNSLQQLTCFDDRHLCLLLLRLGQTLESRVEVVLYLRIDLWHQILLFLADNVEELEALLALEDRSLHVALHSEASLAPFVLSTTNFILEILCLT